LGSNNGPDAAAYLGDMLALVDIGLRAGKTVVVTTPPFASSADHAHLGELAAKIRELKAQRPAILVGPDFYAHFKAHPEQLGDDGLHPNEAGSRAMKRLWRDFFARVLR
jgi:lysophospholipase L1-like esterase